MKLMGTGSPRQRVVNMTGRLVELTNFGIIDIDLCPSATVTTRS